MKKNVRPRISLRRLLRPPTTFVWSTWSRPWPFPWKKENAQKFIARFSPLDAFYFVFLSIISWVICHVFFFSFLYSQTKNKTLEIGWLIFLFFSFFLDHRFLHIVDNLDEAGCKKDSNAQKKLVNGKAWWARRFFLSSIIWNVD